VVKTLTTTGRGITFNALSVIIGFCALPFSSFSPIRFFGFLVIISIFTCLVGALVIVPSLVLVARPKFLEPRQLQPTAIRKLKPTKINPQKPKGKSQLKPAVNELEPANKEIKKTG
jgi:uncharacterized membrane protein YdfJ with MMPL/SSD domain